jgi:PHD/YefM family antitoxin component YafN of YafNO toxin-antitoxin module
LHGAPCAVLFSAGDFGSLDEMIEALADAATRRGLHALEQLTVDRGIGRA